MAKTKPPIPGLAPKSMWGNLKDIETIKPPAAYLQEQATLLTELTGYDLRGTIDKRTNVRGEIETDLDVLVPSLNDYHVTLLRIIHPVDMYPLLIKDFLNDKEYNCKDEEQFLIQLQSILSSPGVRKGISNLKSQATY